MSRVYEDSPNPTKRDTLYTQIFNSAHQAGMTAAENALCTPMIVGSPSTPFGNDIDPSKKTYFVADGVCGFAWVLITPGTHSFAKWLRKTERGSKHYYGGVCIWSSYPSQSMTRNEAYATAFAKFLSGLGIPASMGSRID